MEELDIFDSGPDSVSSGPGENSLDFSTGFLSEDSEDFDDSESSYNFSTSDTNEITPSRRSLRKTKKRQKRKKRFSRLRRAMQSEIFQKVLGYLFAIVLLILVITFFVSTGAIV